jgi:hypothetical protein
VSDGSSFHILFTGGNDGERPVPVRVACAARANFRGCWQLMFLSPRVIEKSMNKICVHINGTGARDCWERGRMMMGK